MNMFDLDLYETLFVTSAFVLQLILVTHFALRKWRFGKAMRLGPIVYSLSIPYAILSIFLLRSGMQWFFGLGGFIYLAWAIFGYTIEYVKHIEWRNALRWHILVPYVTLYLATVMFYWWPLVRVYKPFWYAFGALFLVATYLNITSHKTHSPSPVVAVR